jgi:hypothetical protein
MKVAASITAVAGAVLLSGVAQAATLKADFISRVGLMADGSVQTGASTTLTVDNGGGGFFTFQRNGGDAPSLVPGPAGRFIGICLELGETLVDGTPGPTYTFGNLEGAPVSGSFGPEMSAVGKFGSRANDLRYFLGHVYPVFGGSVQNTDVASMSPAEKAMAVQLVVWEIANEDYSLGLGYKLSDGYLQISNVQNDTANKAFVQAKNWLAAFAALDATNPGWTRLDNLFAIDKPNGKTGQGFVVQAVPIPAAAWLLGSGLLGLFGLARRKKAAAAA